MFYYKIYNDSGLHYIYIKVNIQYVYKNRDKMKELAVS